MEIAITGIGLRLPPNCSTPEEFWNFLLGKGDAISEVPADRWDWRRFYDQDRNRPGKTYVKRAGFLRRDLRAFDPMVFGISPREARGLDPQQRILLEAAWEAFEDAGVAIEALEGSPTGVFIGGFCLDHLLQTTHPANRHLAGSHSATSASMTILANRLSYTFNLSGPSYTLDTACSSSLVALHAACSSIESGDCDQALVGGVNAMTRPEYPIMMAKGQFLSDHGNCRAFDASGSGYVRGEGVGVILIKPLQKALEDDDPIHAVIKGTGVNQDGRTSGISLPNSEAQEKLMRQVYAKAGIDPWKVHYVEAHGTGTQAGDPAEARALDAVFRKERNRENPLWVGSVKTNIGHLEAAAGVAGLIKAIQVLKNRVLPPHLHLEKPNPKIPFEDYCLKIPLEQQALPGLEEAPELYAGINSFGYGGTNAHAVIASAPTPPQRQSSRPNSADQQEQSELLYPLSARSPEALREAGSRLAFFLKRSKELRQPDLLHSLAYRRSHLSHRAMIRAVGLDDLRRKCILLSTGEAAEDVVVGAEAASGELRLGFVCTGMGPQWWGMGLSLFSEEPICRETLDEIEEIFRPMAGWSLKEAILADEKSSRMHRTEVAQPSNLAIQVALARLWEKWGIQPDAIVGHSVGEVSAAYLAGVYSMEEAVLISYHRSRLQQTTAGKGKMLAVGLSEADALERIDSFPGVSVAAINSYASVTLSGDSGELQSIAEALTQEGVFNKFLAVEVAYHSPQMDPLREELLQVLSTIEPKEPKLPLFSTVRGELSQAEDWDSQYWWRNVRQPVRFADAIKHMIESGSRHFLEIGPHPVLKNSIQEVAADAGERITCLPSLRRKEPESPLLKNSLAELYTLGAGLNWKALIPEGGRFVRLPRYAWQRESHWIESEASEMDRLGLSGPVYQNQRVEATRPTWEVEINQNFFPFLPDHGVQDQTVFPGMGYVEAAIFLNATVNGTKCVVLSDIDFEKVLVFDPSQLQHLISSMDPRTGLFELCSRVKGDADSHQRHARGRLSPLTGENDPPRVDLKAARSLCPNEVSLNRFYAKLSRRGLNYGRWFRPLTSVHIGGSSFFANIEVSPEIHPEDHLLHPGILDAALQTILFIARGDRLFVPNSVGRITFHGSCPDHLHAFGELTRQTDSMLEANVRLADPSGRLIAEVEEITCQAIQVEGSADISGLTYLPGWTKSEIPKTTASEAKTVFIQGIDNPSPESSALAQALGATVLKVKPDDWKAEPLHRSLSNVVTGETEIVIPLLEKEQETTVDSPGTIHWRFVTLLQALDGFDFPLRLTAVTMLSQVLETDETPSGISPAATGWVGANEIENLKFLWVDFDRIGGEETADRLRSEWAGETVGEVAWRKAQRWTRSLPRQIPKPQTVKVEECPIESGVKLLSDSVGRIDDLAFVPLERKTPGSGEVEIRILSAALNYKDLLKLYGRLSPLVLKDTFFRETIGMECEGEILEVGEGIRSDLLIGKRVMALLPGAFRSHVTIPGQFVVPSPKGLKKGLSAALPVTFLTAFHALEEVAHMKTGETILIHQATGGLGLAAIEVAKKIGAEIFATAGNETKRAILKDLGIKHVLPSRDLSFASEIRKITKGEGIDVVLSAQSGAAQRESLLLLRPGGRYLEVGKKDIIEDNGIPLRAFNRNLHFASIDMDRLMVERPDYIQHLLYRIKERFESKYFKDPMVQWFTAREIADALRLMAQSQHTGKILIDFSEGNVPVRIRPQKPGEIDERGAYLVTGGTSGFGLETALWLARQGAGKVVLLSRRGMDTPGIAETLDWMEEEGCQAEVVTGDITCGEDVKRARDKMLQNNHRVAGIIHAAMVLDDALLSQVSEERFFRVFRPKVEGALLLAKVFEKDRIDFMVFYSSISSLIGNHGQCAYVAANGWMDGFAHRLRSQGVPAISINWGALAETGVVARSEGLAHLLDSTGVEGLSNTEALRVLGMAIASESPQLAAIRVDWTRWKEAFPKLVHDSRFQAHAEGQGGDSTNPVTVELQEELSSLDVEAQIKLLEGKVANVLSEVLKLQASQIKSESRISEMGVDSLILMELGLALKHQTGVVFSGMEFLKGPSVRWIAETIRDRILKN